MNKKILISLSVIGVVAAIAIGGTIAYFSDTETSTGNTLTAGVIDIVVNGQNPWTKTYSAALSDMKPCQTRWIGFTVKNLVYSNPINLWKHIHITSQTDGYITEPECEEGGGTWMGGQAKCTTSAKCCDGSYEARNNLAAYTIYDMWVCYDPEEGVRCTTNPETGEPSYGGNWIPIITEDQHVRLDNVSSAWIYLGQLYPNKKLRVVQSYHLRSWPGASEPEVTNWAQGDEMTFDIELMATQENAPGPKGAIASLTLENKNPTTWDPVLSDDIGGTLTYNTSGSTFDYNFAGKVPQVSTGYCLIYYADPWPGDGMTHNTGMDIECKASDGSGDLTLAGNAELNTDLPNLDDQNHPGGAKLQVVLESDYDKSSHKMTGWNPTKYLFEMNLITYDDTDN